MSLEAMNPHSAKNSTMVGEIANVDAKVKSHDTNLGLEPVRSESNDISDAFVGPTDQSIDDERFEE